MGRWGCWWRGDGKQADPLHSAGLFNARVCEGERICVCELVARIELPGRCRSGRLMGLDMQSFRHSPGNSSKSSGFPCKRLNCLPRDSLINTASFGPFFAIVTNVGTIAISFCSGDQRHKQNSLIELPGRSRSGHLAGNTPKGPADQKVMKAKML